MAIYIILILTTSVLAFLCKPRNVQYNLSSSGYESDSSTNKYLCVCGFLFIFIAAFRHSSVGIDTVVYEDAFNYFLANANLRDIFTNGRFEPGFSAVIVLLRKLGSFFWLKLFVVTVNVCLIFKAINKYSSIVWLSCLLYFLYAIYRANFNEMRQAVAVAIAIYGFKYIVDKNFWKYLLTISIAFLFHKTALLMIPLFFFAYFDKVKIWHMISIGILFVAIWTYSYFFIDIINLIGRNEYTLNEETGGWALFALQLLTVVIAFIQRDKLNQSRVNIASFYLVSFSLILFPICHLNPTFFRMEFYAWIYMLFLVPNMLKSIENSLIRNIGIICYIGIGLYQAFSQTYTAQTDFIPYMFMWE